MTQYVKYEATTGAAQMSSTPSIFKRPWRVRCVRATAPAASGSVCTVSPRGWSPWASGGRVAARANDPSDDLEPDIEKCNQAAEPEPLKCVTVVFVDACADHGPVASKPLACFARLQHREVGKRQTGFGAKRCQIEILPDARRPLGTVGALELIQT